MKYKRLQFISLFVAFLILLIFSYCIWDRRHESYSLEKHGVHLWNKSATQEGYNLVSIFDPPASGCLILAMDGSLLKNIPGNLCYVLNSGNLAIHIDDGSSQFLAILEPNGIRWKVPLEFSHDIAESWLDESIWAIGYEKYVRGRHFYHDDVIYQYSKNGKLLYRWNATEHLRELSKIFGNPIQAHPPDNIQDKFYIFSHINSLQIIGSNSSFVKNSSFRPGNILLCDDLNSRLFILNPQSNKIVWAHKLPGIGLGLHYARVLPNGNIHFFYNNTSPNLARDDPAQFSLVYEYDPIEEKVLWEYKVDYPDKMYASRYGAAQRLANGNTLISYGGKVREVTPQKKVVWYWENPTKISQNGKAQAIYRMERIPRNKLEKWFSRD